MMCIIWCAYDLHQMCMKVSNFWFRWFLLLITSDFVWWHTSPKMSPRLKDFSLGKDFGHGWWPTDKNDLSFNGKSTINARFHWALWLNCPWLGKLLFLVMTTVCSELRWRSTNDLMCPIIEPPIYRSFTLNDITIFAYKNKHLGTVSRGTTKLWFQQRNYYGEEPSD